MKRKTIIAGNWKMYKTISEAIELANGLKRCLYELEAQEIDIVICPVFISLSEVAGVVHDSNISLGAQDTYWQEEGAFTGEVSPKMLKDAGCSFCIIGHSERRQHFLETNDSVNKKLKALLSCGLTPLMCVGETLAQRERAETFKVLEDHVTGGLKDIAESDIERVVIAYEPVWAIGTGKTATPAQAQEAHAHIRQLLSRLYSKEVAENIRIQYGGSVKPDNIKDLMLQTDIDGALVGGASLTVDSFTQIVTRAYGVRK